MSSIPGHRCPQGIDDMKNSAVLLISCPDRKGIVAGVANFLYEHNANIVHADEHQDSERSLFFLRIEWDLADFTLDSEQFQLSFSQFAEKFHMQWRVAYSTSVPKMAVFVSKEDHCLADLLYRYKSGELTCAIPLIISNHPHAKSLADFYQIPFYEIPVDNDNKEHAEEQALTLLSKYSVDVVVLARYMRILSANFISVCAQPIINIHHSSLPAFIGKNPYHQAYERGVKIIGATSHYVTPDLDQGPIIAQDILHVSHRDSVEDLIQKGRDIEKIVLSRAVKWHINNKILVYANKTVVFD